MGAKPIVTASAVALAFSALWAGTALAGETGESAAGVAVEPPASSAEPDGSQRVCRNVVRSGTRLSKRYCRTQADWDADAKKAGKFVLDGQLNGFARDGTLNTNSINPR